MTDKLVLRHAVGKSTFAEGFAVPKHMEAWVDAPRHGQKRTITLVFDDRTIPAVLRRIDNERGCVQVKYENAEGSPFRDWLATVFIASLTGAQGEFIELHKIGPDLFRVRAVPVSSDEPSLRTEEWICHRGADRLLRLDTPLAEIPAIVRTIPFRPERDQAFYNQGFSKSFGAWNWQAERKAITQLGLRCDFAKDDVLVEVEFGNASTYYQDLVKFLLGNRYSGTTVGVLIVPTTQFADHLCELGRQRANKKGKRYYSGMMSFDKVQRELPFLEFLLDMPIVVMGIGSAHLDPH